MKNKCAISWNDPNIWDISVINYKIYRYVSDYEAISAPSWTSFGVFSSSFRLIVVSRKLWYCMKPWWWGPWIGFERTIIMPVFIPEKASGFVAKGDDRGCLEKLHICPGAWKKLSMLLPRTNQSMQTRGASHEEPNQWRSQSKFYRSRQPKSSKLPWCAHRVPIHQGVTSCSQCIVVNPN